MNQLDTRTIRIALWGVLLIWIGIMGSVDEPAGVASIGAGVILLTGAAFRRAIGARAGFVLTSMGALLIVLGLLNDTVTIPLFAVALIAVGTLIVVRALTARAWVKRQVTGIKVWLPDDVRTGPRPPQSPK